MPRVVGDRVEPFRTHGLRRTDQIRAEIAVSRAAKAVMINGSMMSKATSESGWELSSLFVPSRKGGLMRRRVLGMLSGVLAVSLGCASPATAQVHLGRAVAVDGDSLNMGDMRFRLLGIDALEARQACTRRGEAWACGEEAAAVSLKTGR